jgi:hypothetical protein
MTNHVVVTLASDVVATMFDQLAQAVPASRLSRNVAAGRYTHMDLDTARETT